MYIPDAFAASEMATLHDLIDEYGFGTLITNGPDGPVATHLPFLIDRDRGRFGTLICHMARANPQWHAFDGGPCLAVFLGPHGYISPNWYASKPAVPTWNYAAVHAYGAPRLIEDPEQLRALVARLADHHEAGRLPAWSIETLPPAFASNMMRGIVGIEIEIARLEGKRKLSQNRTAADRSGVIAALDASGAPGDRALAGYMQRHAAP